MSIPLENAILYTYIKRPHMLTLNKLDLHDQHLTRGEQAVVDNVLCLHLLYFGAAVERRAG